MKPTENQIKLELPELYVQLGRLDLYHQMYIAGIVDALTVQNARKAEAQGEKSAWGGEVNCLGRNTLFENTSSVSPFRR